MGDDKSRSLLSFKERWRQWVKRNAEWIMDKGIILPFLFATAGIGIYLFAGVNLLSVSAILVLIILVFFLLKALWRAAGYLAETESGTKYVLSQRRIATLESVGVQKDIIEYLNELLLKSTKKRFISTFDEQKGWLKKLEQEIGRRRFEQVKESLLEYTCCD